MTVAAMQMALMKVWALPSRPIERGRPGPGLLAHVLVGKYADHLPLYRQSQIFERDGLDLDRSTLADWVGKSTALLEPLADAIGRHVLAAGAIFADDTPIRMLAPGTGKTQTARLWTYARDERPWGGPAPPAAWYRFSGDRKGEHPKDHLARFRGCMHADGYAGFDDLYRSGAIREVACMAHVRRKFVDVHRSQASPIAEEAIQRIARLYAVEKEARGSPPERRVDAPPGRAPPRSSMISKPGSPEQLARISGKSPLAAAIRYALARMERMRPYLAHGILELDNNAAERGMRAIALGRKNYLFVGSEAGGKAAAIAYTLIETAKLNGVDPASLARRHPGPHPGLQDHQGRRAAPLALEAVAVRPDAYDKSDVFDSLRELLSNSGVAGEIRLKIEVSIDEMEGAHGGKDFIEKYQSFMSTTSDHIAIFGPMLGYLASLLPS